MEDDQIKVIERETKEQSLNLESNLNWNEARKFRITASKCKRVASMKESTFPVAALQEILHYKQPFQTDFMKKVLTKSQRSSMNTLLKTRNIKVTVKNVDSLKVHQMGFCEQAQMV